MFNMLGFNLKILIVPVAAVIASMVLVFSISTTYGLDRASLPPYARLTDASVSGTPGVVVLSVSTEGNIPKNPNDENDYTKAGITFGYGWLDSSTGNAITTAIHMHTDGSMNNPNTWHIHFVKVAVNSSAVEGSSFPLCIEEGGPASAGVKVKNNQLEARVAENKVPNFNPDIAASFIKYDVGHPALAQVEHEAGTTGLHLGQEKGLDVQPIIVECNPQIHKTDFPPLPVGVVNLDVAPVLRR